MQVLSQPSTWIHTCKCVKCSSELEIDEHDICIREQDKFFSSRITKEIIVPEYHYVICDICFNEVVLDKNILPKGFNNG